MRDLAEWPVLIRYNDAVDVIRKVQSFREGTISELASPLMPFGLPTNCRGTKVPNNDDDLILHSSAGISYFPRKELPRETMIKWHPGSGAEPEEGCRGVPAGQKRPRAGQGAPQGP